MIRKIILAATLALALAGCATSPSLKINSAVSLNTMLGVESAYGIALSGELAYKALPLCKTGTVIAVDNVCARRSVIVRLQAADLKAISSIRAANGFIKTYPTVDASNVISAASAAVSALQGILNSSGAN